ncbi:MAG: hypothetical protein ACI9OJ_000172 [Myxococcota bacterium]|jgi:hypothetical protein
MPDFPPVEPHGALQPIFDDAWFLTGSVSFKPLVRLSRNMIVLRDGGDLVLINAVRLDAAGEAALDALGTVRHVMKIGMHSMDDAYYTDKYAARHWTVDDLKGADTLPIANLRAIIFKDTVLPEAALLLERSGGLLITCDSVQHWVPSDLMSPVAKLITRFLGFQHPAQVGPPWRKKQTPEGGSLHNDFKRLCELKFDRLIGGHGGLLEADACTVLASSVARNFPGED